MDKTLSNEAILKQLFRHEKKNPRKRKYVNIDKLLDEGEPAKLNFHKEWKDREEYLEWKKIKNKIENGKS